MHRDLIETRGSDLGTNADDSDPGSTKLGYCGTGNRIAAPRIPPAGPAERQHPAVGADPERLGRRACNIGHNAQLPRGIVQDDDPDIRIGISIRTHAHTYRIWQ